jgi:hypothetical protein
MHLHFRHGIHCASAIALVIAFVIALAANSAMAQDYTVTRSLSENEATACDDGSVTVTLQGDSTGNPGDTITVREFIQSNGNISEINVTGVTNGVVPQEVLPPPPPTPTPIGDHFINRTVVEQVEVADGSINNTTVVGDPADGRYLSEAQNGGDVWSGGDTFEFAYADFSGDFDVSVFVDPASYTHSSNAGCWGKFGLMARQDLGPLSRMIYLQNHGANRPENEVTCALPTQSTGVLGRNMHEIAGQPPGNMFEIVPQILDDGSTNGIFESWHYHETDGQTFPDKYYEFDYLRLTRRDNTIQAWATNDPIVTTSPGEATDDANWIEYKRPSPGGDNDVIPLEIPPEDAGLCWSIGFAHSTHNTHGNAIETIEFEVVHWEGTDPCTRPPPPAPVADTLLLEWADIQRSAVDAGLSYSIESQQTETPEDPFQTIRATFDSRIDDNGLELLAGGEAFADVTDVQSVGDLLMRSTGESGSGTGSFDGQVYTVTGQGTDIWQGGDHMNFIYDDVSDDFEATAFLVDSDLTQGGTWGKMGLMARETCHEDARYDFIQWNGFGGEGARFSLRHGQRDGSATNEKGIVDEVLPGAPEDPGTLEPIPNADPDWVKLIRTGSQISGYIAWDDPDNFITPIHWNFVGSRNVEGRADDLHVGMALNSFNDTTFNSMQFTLDIQPYAVPPIDGGVIRDGALLLERNFDSEGNGSPPEGGFVGVRPFGGFEPNVQDGRLRMTDASVPNSASAVWFKDGNLNGILDSGFVAEFDVRITSDLLNPGEGGMFVVLSNADDQFAAVTCGGTTVIEEFTNISQVVGTDESGFVEFGGVDRNGPGTGDDVYTNLTGQGGQIWQNCDNFTFDYEAVTGDFDIVIEILELEHETGFGQFNKSGIMARETLETNSRFYMIHDTNPDDEACCGGEAGLEPSFSTFRATNAGGDGCDDTVQIPTPFRHPAFLRLTRIGNVLQGWVSTPSGDPENPSANEQGLRDGTLNPHNNCNWFPGTAAEIDDLPADIFLGFANNVDITSGDVFHKVVYRILEPNPGGVVDDPGQITGLVGFSREMGFGHIDGALTGAGSPAAVPTEGLRAISEGRPMLALEIDTRISPDEAGGGPAIEGSGAPDDPGTYHVAVNVGAITHSRQTNEQFGVDPDDLPDVFAGDVRMTLQYEPNGRVQAWVESNQGPLQVINTYIPPLAFGAGFNNPIVGFVASTHDVGVQTLEFDNLSIRRLSGGDTSGACCTDGNCDVQTQASCEAGGGTYQGDDSTCGAVNCSAQPLFRRGDHDGSGLVDITDPLNLLGFLFLGQTPPICEDASDYDNSALLDISDPLNALGFLFLGNNITPAPGAMNCGLDPTDAIDDGNDPPPNGPDGLPAQPAASLGCDMYPSAVGMACP